EPQKNWTFSKGSCASAAPRSRDCSRANRWARDGSNIIADGASYLPWDRQVTHREHTAGLAYGPGLFHWLMMAQWSSATTFRRVLPARSDASRPRRRRSTAAASSRTRSPVRCGVRSGRASLGGFAELTECPEREAGYAEELWCPVMRTFHETVTWR